MRGDPALHLGEAGKRPVPARLEFAGDHPVDGIGRVILTEGAVGGVARRFKVTAESLANLIPSFSDLPRGYHRRRDSDGTNHAEQRFLNGIVDAQAAEGDAARLSVVHPAAGAAIARDLMLHAAVAERQLAAAAPAADQADKQCLAVLGRAMMPA